MSSESLDTDVTIGGPARSEQHNDLPPGVWSSARPSQAGTATRLRRLRRSGLGLLGGAVEGVAEGVAHLVGTEPELGKGEHEPIGGGGNALTAFT